MFITPCVSRDKCHGHSVTVSRCNMYFFINIFFYQSSEAIRWRVCCKRGDPVYLLVVPLYVDDSELLDSHSQSQYLKTCKVGGCQNRVIVNVGVLDVRVVQKRLLCWIFLNIGL